MPKPPEACEDVNQAFAVEEDKGSCASIGLGCLIQGLARLRFFVAMPGSSVGRSQVFRVWARFGVLLEIFFRE